MLCSFSLCTLSLNLYLTLPNYNWFLGGFFWTVLDLRYISLSLQLILWGTKPGSKTFLLSWDFWNGVLPDSVFPGMNTSAFMGLEEPLAMKAGSLGHTTHIPGAALPQGAVSRCMCPPHLSSITSQSLLWGTVLQQNRFSELKSAVNIL